ncbi:hypothetical protein GCM10009760_55620 [Kitasatospora kazusensis]|uniref:Uncharacterized protein n=1 Tax=Kitasatospora kazusensis TaxID=407974 RepID=A0ABN3A885_9ACTN
MNANRPLITAVAGGMSTPALALTGAPWWLTALAFGCFALSLLVVALQSVFPQESAHRLAWWRARWRHQQLRRQSQHSHHLATGPGTRAARPDRPALPGGGSPTHEATRHDC